MEMNKRLREHIVSNGLHFSFVAENAGIGIKKFSRMMTNKQRITTEEYEDICIKGLKISPAFFYSEKFLKTKNIA